MAKLKGYFTVGDATYGPEDEVPADVAEVIGEDNFENESPKRQDSASAESESRRKR